MKAILLAVAMVGLIGAVLSSAAVAAAPALPGERCATSPKENWTEPERWAWNEICEGRVADFNRKFGLSAPLDPEHAEGWGDTRRISQNALETILAHEPFRSAIPRRGVRIDGAWFPEKINLVNARVDHVLWLVNSRFEQGLDLFEAQFQKRLTLDGSSVAGALNMGSLEVGSSLFMRDGAEFAEVDLRSAKVGGQLDMTGTKVSGALNMNSLEVSSSLHMRDGAEFSEVDLRGAKVGGEFAMIGAKVSGALNMNSLEVGINLLMGGGAEFADVDLGAAKVGGGLDMSGINVSGTLQMHSLEVGSHLYMRGGAEFAEVNLVGAKVGGQLDMTGTKVSGALVMGSLDVGSSLFMGGGAEFAEVVLFFANIGANLDLSGATLMSLDLTGSKIGELRLGSGIHPSAQWRDGGFLVLRNTQVDALQDRLEPDPWPSQMVLDGFAYKRLGGLAGAMAEADVVARPVSWFIGWLARDKTYSAQPYRQLAGVLRAAGENGKADAIIYAGWEREREQVESSARWWALTLIKYTIGYGLGYRYFWSLFWVGGFVLIGVAVLWRSGAIRSNGLPWTLACSLDLLLPIVKLNERHGEYVQQMGGWGVYYFYAHQLVGWVLASFLIAGLGGLTEL